MRNLSNKSRPVLFNNASKAMCLKNCIVRRMAYFSVNTIVVGYSKMTRYIILISGLLTFGNSFCEQKCDSSNLQADKILLQKFWTRFKKAINNNDKAKLASLCRFPFNCDYCILDSTKSSDNPYHKVTKAAFDKSQYQIFFTKRLVKEVNKHKLPQDLFIFQPYFNTIDKKCSYSFSCIALDENVQHSGMQHFFDIQEFKGQFKIISAWTVP